MSYSPLELAEAFVRAGELEDALDALNAHLNQTPGDDDAHRLRAAVLSRFPDDPTRLRAALTDYDAIQTPTGDDDDRRATLLEKLGDGRGAIAALERARTLNPDDPRLNERQIQVLLRLGAYDEVEAMLAALPLTWRWLGWSGDVAALRGVYEAAVERYSGALLHLQATQDMKNPVTRNFKAQLLIKRARAYRHLKRCAEGDADYVEAENIVLNDPTILFERGLLLFECSRDLHRALPLCRDALDGAPPALREMMRKTLLDDRRYVLLAKALLP